MWVNSFQHSKNATNSVRGLMISMELELAAEEARPALRESQAQADASRGDFGFRAAAKGAKDRAALARRHSGSPVFDFEN